VNVVRCANEYIFDIKQTKTQINKLRTQMWWILLTHT